MAIVSWIWFFCVLILTGYHLVIFRRRKMPRTLPFIDWPGVSIVIAHKNHSHFVKQNLESINKQDYPSFEIILIDDNSSEPEKNALHEIASGVEKVKVLQSNASGKKAAINQAVHAAQYEYILCTDADCQPVSDQWIKKMVQSGRGGKMVLGYSPYIRKKGWLNKLLRFETVMTAMQYISWTWAGKPYMGVGRNMMYHRELFQTIDPYHKDQLLYGDDDLWVQKAAHHTWIKICDDAGAHVISEPAADIKSWWRQKHRHLSAGHEYNKGAWLQPGVYGVALIGNWLLILVLLFCSHWANWLPVFLIGLLIRWFNYNVWTKQLGSRDTIAWYPVLEIQYAVYLMVGGVVTLFNKKRTWS
ncbi:MAG TPA: glycosyltransferase [Saprospiraceae bacterium]|nr:glycosyltransferase [Saprospiraceae bacterium]